LAFCAYIYINKKDCKTVKDILNSMKDKFDEFLKISMMPSN